MPAEEQLKRIVANRELVNPALQEIDGIILDGWIWSSSEYDGHSAWGVYAYSGGVLDADKGYGDGCVRCVLAF